MSDLKISGFPEFLPTAQAVENYLKSRIAKRFELYGYANIDTPVVERNEVLLAKSTEELSKQIFGVYGLAQGAADLKGYSMRFDLTVPLARYVVEHESELRFPFRRYQMQKVYRGERAQKGRYREFTQCDVDVLATEDNPAYDIETMQILYDAVRELLDTFAPSLTLLAHVNDRKIFNAIADYLELPEETRKKLLPLLDEFLKLPKEKFETYATEILGEKKARFFEIFELTPASGSFPSEAIKTAYATTGMVIESLKKSGINAIFDPYIIRGQDYYTGTVFEFKIPERADLGTIAGGGRYDKLVTAIREKFNLRGENYYGVGGAIGFSRITQWILAEFPEKFLPLADVMIFNLFGEVPDYRNEIASNLRSAGIRTEMYFQDAKLKKQFDFAASKNIPFGIMAGQNEFDKKTVVIKDLFAQTSEEIPVEQVADYMLKNKGKYGIVN